MFDVSRIELESSTLKRDSRVCENWSQLAVSWVPPDTWNPVGRWGDHPLSLNTTQRPIVNQYREGKVKSTPLGEWNSSWNLVPTSTESSSMSDRVPFVEWSGELMYLARLRSFALQPQGNRVLNGRLVICIRPETEWPIHGQVEARVTPRGGPNRPPLKWWRMSCG